VVKKRKKELQAMGLSNCKIICQMMIISKEDLKKKLKNQNKVWLSY
jgi:sulfur relay (sulfurtransferase) DsrF/TusC family protein